MPANPRNFVLPNLKQLKVKPHKMLRVYINQICSLNSPRRRILTPQNVRPVYIGHVKEYYRPNDPQVAELEREAMSNQSKPLWEELLQHAVAGTDDADLEDWHLPRFTAAQFWDDLTYEEYIEHLRIENPGKQVLKSVANRLLRRYFAESSQTGKHRKVLEKRLDNLLAGSKAYWKRHQSFDDGGNSENEEH
ncbi:MAG: hypothetical protein M1820_005933 [Bogoriella megaspora]|nr:MAG: hypothetical protein M1820_005933 [Bogoriella megaspora]